MQLSLHRRITYDGEHLDVVRDSLTSELVIAVEHYLIVIDRDHSSIQNADSRLQLYATPYGEIARIGKKLRGHVLHERFVVDAEGSIGFKRYDALLAGQHLEQRTLDEGRKRR